MEIYLSFFQAEQYTNLVVVLGKWFYNLTTYIKATLYKANVFKLCSKLYLECDFSIVLTSAHRYTRKLSNLHTNLVCRIT